MAKKREAKLAKSREEPLINKRIQFELAVFFAKHSPKRVNRNLRDLVLHYLSSQPDASNFNLDGALNDISKLMKILDKAEDILTQRTVKEIMAISEKGNYYPELNIDDLEINE